MKRWSIVTSPPDHLVATHRDGRPASQVRAIVTAKSRARAAQLVGGWSTYSFGLYAGEMERPPSDAVEGVEYEPSDPGDTLEPR